MDSKKRLLKALRGEKADRVPVSFFIQEVFTSYFFKDSGRNNRIDDAYEVAKELGLDIQLRPNSYSQLPYDIKANNWDVKIELREENNKKIKEISIVTPDKYLSERTVTVNINNYKKFVSVSKKIINDENDFRAFKKYFPVDSLKVNRKKTGVVISHAKNLLSGDGIVIPWTSGSIYNSASNFIKEDFLLMLPYLKPELYSEIMNLFLELNMEYSENFAVSGCEFVGVAGNIANGRVISKQYFNDFILPYEKKFISGLKKDGVFTLYHNCGYLGDLVDCYLEMGIDALETLTPPPYADANIAEIKNKVGGKIGLMGGFDQIRLLKEGSREEILSQADRILEMGKPRGGYVFAASDWLEEDTPISNIKLLIEYIRKNGSYK